MPWFAVDDRFWSHPKTIRMQQSPDYAAAVCLWTLAGSWCAAHAWDDGVVPAHVLDKLAGKGWRAAAAALLDVGLWDADRGDFAFHDWADWNGPDAKSRRIDRRLANDRERQRRRRLKESKSEIARANARDRKARWRKDRCNGGNHSAECPKGCPARA